MLQIFTETPLELNIVKNLIFFFYILQRP
jgi:hypothetical protein